MEPSDVLPKLPAYVNRQPRAKTAVERMADKSRSKLLLKYVSSFRFIDTWSHTITIDEDATTNVTSSERAMPVPRPISAPSVKQSTTSAQSESAYTVEQSVHDARRDTSALEATRDMMDQTTLYVPPTPDTARNKDMYWYVVDHIARHVSMKDGLRYIVSWC